MKLWLMTQGLQASITLGAAVVIAMNVYSYWLFYHDKHLAIAGKYRVSERRLLTVAMLFGGIGALLAMRRFRHKTTKKLFKRCVPLSAAMTLSVLLGLAYISLIMLQY